MAFYGFVTGETVQTYLGIVTAVCFSAIGSYGYLRQIWDSWELKRDAARAEFRREQELLDEQLKIKIEQLHHETEATA